MKKKNKFLGLGGIPKVPPELPIQDDPYWKVSSMYLDAHRLGRSLDRFERFGYQHPQWVDDLINGIPTYYCVLGVHRGATAAQVIQAFRKKVDPSFYPLEVLNEAMIVLSSLELQIAYDELLYVFEQFTKCMPPFEKKELIARHADLVATAKQFDTVVQANSKFGDYFSLFISGMPDLYEFVGLSKDSDIETIERNCRQDSEFFRKVHSILTTSRKDYDLMLAFFTENITREEADEWAEKRRLWKEYDREMVERIILLTLSEPNIIQNYFTRSSAIMNTNQDWKQYLPPSKNSFFSIIGLEAGLLQVDKKEVEGVIRDRYRQLERTPPVNLAYSVLKNQTLREDYLWLYENHVMIEALAHLLSVKTVREIPIIRFKTNSHNKKK